MVGVLYVGANQGGTRDLVSYQYVQSLLGLNLSQLLVDLQINTALAGYVTKAYVDTQDALNATKAYVDSADALKLHTNQIGVNNGAAGLLVGGRLDPARVSAASTQRFPKPFTSPSAYNGSAVAVTTTETTVFPVSVADPGFTYKLFITGVLDASSSVDGEYPIVKVHQGATGGQIVAGGYGLGEKYPGGVLTTYSGRGTSTYTVPTWTSTLDVITLGGGGGGGNGAFFIAGAGGDAGSFSGVTLTKGSTLPNTTTTLTANVGAGGSATNNGGSSTVTGTGVTTITGGGGDGQGNGFSANGAAAGTFNFGGNAYVGGGAATTRKQVGNPPGGGGSAASIATFDTGGAGADGAIWIFAKPAGGGTPSGPVNIVPTPLNAQTAITGATTLYVMVSRSGTTSTQTVSTTVPKIMVIPVPA
jgi:hypothetical protein